MRHDCATMLLLFLLQISWITNVAMADEFAFRDGDTVAFLGDSITAARTYGKVIENYTLLRFPDRRIHFINVGIGGDTAAGGLARLERDVFARGATVVTVAYGINDIGWGMRADDDHKQLYLKSITEIVRKCRERGVRVYICSAAIVGHDPTKTENDFLQTMCDEGMKVSLQNGGQSIDVQRTMREIQKRMWKANESNPDPARKESMHTADNVHLNDLGQLAMAYAILKGLDAPADVSSVSLDANQKKLLASSGCQVSNIFSSADRLEFTRLDEGLPLNAEAFFALNFRFIPIHDQLNRYLLQIKSLPAGEYDMVVDGRKVGTYSADQLKNQVNVSSATPDAWRPGGPWDAQANILFSLTESRNKLEMSQSLASTHFPDESLTKDFSANVRVANTQLEELQRQIAKPRPYHFVIEKTKPNEAGAAPLR